MSDLEDNNPSDDGLLIAAVSVHGLLRRLDIIWAIHGSKNIEHAQPLIPQIETPIDAAIQVAASVPAGCSGSSGRPDGRVAASLV